MLRKLGTALSRGLVVLGAVVIAIWVWLPGAWAQTQIVLTNALDYTVANGKSLTGVYECSDGGYIDSSCIIGHFPEVSCPAGYAIQVISSGITPATCIAVGTGTPAGSDTYVQYNASGVFGADQNFTWNYVSSILHLGGAGPGEATFGGDVLANLGTPSNGTLAYCNNCTDNTSPCTTGGTGAFARRLNGAWVCGTPSSGGTAHAPDNSVQYNGGSGAFGGTAKFTYTPGTNPLPNLTDTILITTSLFEMDTGVYNQFATYGGANELRGNPFLISASVTPDVGGTRNGYFAGDTAEIDINATGSGSSAGGGKDNAVLTLSVNASAGSATIPTGSVIGGSFTVTGAVASSEFRVGDNSQGVLGEIALETVSNANSSGDQAIGIYNVGESATARTIGAFDEGTSGAGLVIGTLGNAWGSATNKIGGYFSVDATTLQTTKTALAVDGTGGNEIIGYNSGTQNFLLDNTFPTTGSAGGKKVVCVDTTTGKLYASSTGVDCSN